MYEVFLDALIDSAKMIPLLLVIYIGIELVEYKYGNRIGKSVQKAGAAGPAIGALSGSIPQCGFSVMATALYTQRLVTLGTLLAVYLSTSDEAIPVILSQPDKVGIIIPLILTKIVIAVICGYAIDLIFRKNGEKTLAHIEAFADGTDEEGHHHETVLEEPACCGHKPTSAEKRFDPKEIFLHPVIHTLKIFAFILIVSFLINYAVFALGEQAFASFFVGHVFLQPFLAALVGLIPNCAASVAITELYLQGAITYGAVIAGLCASGGLGILVLFKEDKDKKEALRIVALLFGISVAAGLILQYLC